MIDSVSKGAAEFELSVSNTLYGGTQACSIPQLYCEERASSHQSIVVGFELTDGISMAEPSQQKVICPEPPEAGAQT
jgi:hypothetical protein